MGSLSAPGQGAARGLDALLEASPPGPRQHLIVGLLLVTLLIEGIDLQLLSMVAPLMLVDLGVARSAFGGAMSAALVGMSIGAGIGGWLGDRVGRKRVLVVSALLFGLSTAAVATADSVTQVTLLRFAGGLGFGAAAPPSLALVTEWLPPRRRPFIISLVAIGVPMGGLVGSLVLLGALQELGWRGSFVLFGALSVLLGLLAAALVPESPAWLLARGRRDAALALLRRHLVLLPADATQALAAPAGVAESAAATAAAGARPALFMAGARVAVGLWVGLAGATFIAYALIAWGTVLWTGQGLSVPVALQAILLFNLCSVITSIASGFIVRREGSRRVMLLACIGILAGVGLLAVGLGLPPGDGRMRLVITLAGGLTGGSTGCVITTSYMVLTHAYPPTARAFGTGAALMVGRGGAILSTFTGGLLLAMGAGGGPGVFLAALSVCAVVTLVGVLIIDRHVPRAG